MCADCFIYARPAGVLVDELNISLGGENSNNESVSGGESARSVVVRTKTDFGYAKIDRRQNNVLENVVRKADFYRGETLDSSGCRVAAALPHPLLHYTLSVGRLTPEAASVGIETFRKRVFLRFLMERANNDEHKKKKTDDNVLIPNRIKKIRKLKTTQ